VGITRQKRTAHETKKWDAMTPANNRGKGEGSFYQRESDGRWFGAITLPDANGDRKRRTVSSADREKAQEKFDALIAEHTPHTIYMPEELGQAASTKAAEQDQTLSEAVKPLIETWVSKK